ncbi:MAG TPA: hypothetical protein VLC51_04640 [Nitrospira sp.]|jgi:ATP-dependent DNA ligase|nr:hypothetical protein [Nitrospira sp.]
MIKAFEFCIPTRSTNVHFGSDWLHEIKYDGYRLRVERNGERVRLTTRGGYDWSKRFPVDRGGSIQRSVGVMEAFSLLTMQSSALGRRKKRDE